MPASVPLDSFLEAFPHDQPDWLVDGIIEKGELMLLFGDSFTGKTYLALDLAFHVAAGYDWHGYSVDPGGVMYVATERPREFARRSRAWLSHHRTSSRALDLHMYRDNLDLTDSASIDALFNSLAESDPSLLIVDIFTDTIPGVEENGPELGRMLKRLDLSEQSIAVIVCHHTTKYANGTYRGHSSLKANAHSMARLVKEDKRSEPNKTVLTWDTADKTQNDPFNLEITLHKPEGLWKPIITDVSAQRRGSDAVLRAIDELTRDGECRYEDLYERFTASNPATVRGWVSERVRQGLVASPDRDHAKGKRFELTPDGRARLV